VRKEPKLHALGRQIEGPPLTDSDRCMIVEDVVTTGASTVRAIEVVRGAGHEICGVLAICDRLAGGAEAIERAAGAPFLSLTTIDEIYPERPDR
jgi:orotate phosphoribosyltransferase